MMKKNWNPPDIETLDIEQTMNNIIINEEEDEIYAGQFGDNPQGYKCSVRCS